MRKRRKKSLRNIRLICVSLNKHSSKFGKSTPSSSKIRGSMKKRKRWSSKSQNSKRLRGVNNNKRRRLRKKNLNFAKSSLEKGGVKQKMQAAFSVSSKSHWVSG